MAGTPSKSKTGMVVGIVVGFLGFVLIVGSVLFFFRGRHKGYRREVFVDVAGLCQFCVVRSIMAFIAISFYS